MDYWMWFTWLPKDVCFLGNRWLFRDFIGKCDLIDQHSVVEFWLFLRFIFKLILYWVEFFTTVLCTYTMKNQLLIWALYLEWLKALSNSTWTFEHHKRSMYRCTMYMLYRQIFSLVWYIYIYFTYCISKLIRDRMFRMKSYFFEKGIMLLRQITLIAYAKIRI